MSNDSSAKYYQTKQRKAIKKACERQQNLFEKEKSVDANDMRTFKLLLKYFEVLLRSYISSAYIKLFLAIIRYHVL